MLNELALDPPDSTEDFAGDPLLDEDYLILSTIHSAKGLEWDVVYVIHAADGNIPADLATRNAEEIDEELRLFYVALTRPRPAVRLLSAPLLPRRPRFAHRPARLRPAHAVRFARRQSVLRRAGRRFPSGPRTDRRRPHHHDHPRDPRWHPSSVVVTEITIKAENTKCQFSTVFIYCPRPQFITTLLRNRREDRRVIDWMSWLISFSPAGRHHARPRETSSRGPDRVRGSCLRSIRSSS